jgi:hypothetical protein
MVAADSAILADTMLLSVRPLPLVSMLPETRLGSAT